MEKYLSEITDCESVPVVINQCYGGFGLSGLALTMYNKLTDTKVEYADNIERTDPILVKIVRELKKEANDTCAQLQICKIPNYMLNFYTISEYDGMESVKLKTDQFKISVIKQINNDADLDHKDQQVLINKIIEIDIPHPQRENKNE